MKTIWKKYTRKRRWPSPIHCNLHLLSKEDTLHPHTAQSRSMKRTVLWWYGCSCLLRCWHPTWAPVSVILLVWLPHKLPEKQQRMAQAHGPLNPHGWFRRSCWLLALDPLNFCCGHLRSGIVGWTSLPPFFSLSTPLLAFLFIYYCYYYQHYYFYCYFFSILHVCTWISPAVFLSFLPISNHHYFPPYY